MKFKTLGLGSMLALSTVTMCAHADIKIGMLAGITGGAAALAPDVIKGFELAAKEVNEQGGVLNGEKLVGVLSDDGCSPQIAADAATKAVNVSQVVAMVGPLCSGAVLAAANTATIPAGVALISPGATSPQVTLLKDKDTVFRTTPSDEYQGQALARGMLARGVKTIAVSFLNNDYGKGFAEAFKSEYEKQGGKIAGYAAHEENKSSYRTDLAQLARGGADTLLIIAYSNSSGITILREALENGFFANYVGGDGFKNTALIKTLGLENLKPLLVSAPISDSSSASEIFSKAMKANGGNPDAVYSASGYDAVFITALAIEVGRGERAKIPAAIRAVTKPGGEPILPGEWKKAKAFIDEGKAVTYNGASGALVFDANGDVPGSYGLFHAVGEDFQKLTDMK